MNAAPEAAPPAPLLRAFIAAPIPEPVRRALAEAQERLKQTGLRAAWVAPANIHLTLLFLGTIFDPQAEALAADLDALAAACPACSLRAEGLGFFGAPRAPRVIWAGLSGTWQPLEALRGALVAAARTRGVYTQDLPLAPHLTLARVRSPARAAALPEALAAFRGRDFGALAVDRVLLMKSALQASGAVYSLLHESRLAG